MTLISHSARVEQHVTMSSQKARVEQHITMSSHSARVEQHVTLRSHSAKVEQQVTMTGVVTVQDSQSGKSFSSILNLAKNVQKSPIKC